MPTNLQIHHVGIVLAYFILSVALIIMAIEIHVAWSAAAVASVIMLVMESSICYMVFFPKSVAQSEAQVVVAQTSGETV